MPTLIIQRVFSTAGMPVTPQTPACSFPAPGSNRTRSELCFVKSSWLSVERYKV